MYPRSNRVLIYTSYRLHKRENISIPLFSTKACGRGEEQSNRQFWSELLSISGLARSCAPKNSVYVA